MFVTNGLNVIFFGVDSSAGSNFIWIANSLNSSGSIAWTKAAKWLNTPATGRGLTFGNAGGFGSTGDQYIGLIGGVKLYNYIPASSYMIQRYHEGAINSGSGRQLAMKLKLTIAIWAAIILLLVMSAIARGASFSNTTPGSTLNTTSTVNAVWNHQTNWMTNEVTQVIQSNLTTNVTTLSGNPENQQPLTPATNMITEAITEGAAQLN